MTLLFTHRDCLLHEMNPGHPERPARLAAVLDHLDRTGMAADLDVRLADSASLENIDRIHDPGYLSALDAASPTNGLVQVDPDTIMCPQSLHAAKLAVGAIEAAVDAVLEDTAKTAFCAVRPPGHHAERDAAMGFCFYNGIAIGAERALSQPAINRVAILDFDVHHGNGTVDIFADRPEVLVCSSFQYPFYPYRLQDVDRPNIVNTPLPVSADGNAFRSAIEADWLPAIEAHQPDLVLISAGFDAHRDDPLGGLNLVEADFRWVTDLIVDAARANAGGRIVSALEGGYDLDALARSVHVHLEGLLAAS